MGNDISSAQQRQIEALDFRTPFNRPELKVLARRFNAATHRKGFMTPAEFRDYIGLDKRHGWLSLVASSSSSLFMVMLSVLI